MSQKIWEVEVRVLMDGEEESTNLFFELYPTKEDVQDALTKRLASAGDEWTKTFFQGTLQVVEHMVTEWFEVGTAGGRPSHKPSGFHGNNYLGYVQVFDHELIQNI